MMSTDRLNVVFDLTYNCNLNCAGCAVNAKLIRPLDVAKKEHSSMRYKANIKEITTILEKIKEFQESQNRRIFIDFGGGEPTVLENFTTIIKIASDMFGPENIGFDTNGVNVTKSLLVDIEGLVGYIGFSVDGLLRYHNWWKDPLYETGFQNPFDLVIKHIRDALNLQRLKNTVEVTCVPTKRNLDEIPKLMRLMSEIGVEQFSFHRTMPIGRMRRHLHLVPDWMDYLQLLAYAARARARLDLDVHLHHSLESIYAKIFLEKDTISQIGLLCPAARSSIGIDPRGHVYFCPWCVSAPLSVLSVGSLLNPRNSLNVLLESDIMSMAREACMPQVRCRRCPERCSGGCRIAAIMDSIKFMPLTTITLSDILAGFHNRDPACPLSHMGY